MLCFMNFFIEKKAMISTGNLNQIRN